MRSDPFAGEFWALRNQAADMVDTIEGWAMPREKRQPTGLHLRGSRFGAAFKLNDHQGCQSQFR